MEQQTFTLATADFDASLLPAGSRAMGTAGFREAVNQFFVDAFKGFGGSANIAVDEQQIRVSWSRDAREVSHLSVIAGMIERGQRKEAVQLLKLLLARDPQDVDLISTLGMVLSDDGKLDEAAKFLRKAVELAPERVNNLVAYGVALSRQQMNAGAVEVLESAVRLDGENPWARLNLGITLLKDKRPAEAADHLRHAVRLKPDDQRSWLALAEACGSSGNDKEAEAAYAHVLALNPHNDFAEMARAGSSRLAQASFDSKSTTGLRMDAVHYCSAAIKHFALLPKSEVQKITFEISMEGRNGFDVNDPERKRRLKSLPGEFSSLQLVCYMFVGFQIIAPGTDIGFDLMKEYAMAKGM